MSLEPFQCHTRLALVILLICWFVSSHAAAEDLEFSLDHDGEQRSYQLFIPDSYQKEKALPLLIVLHGRNSDNRRMADLTSFNLRADSHGFVVAYPNGLSRQWNYLHGANPQAGTPNDSEYLLKVKQDIQTRYTIDSKRVYATGISNGGFMVQRLACYAPDQFAAFASVAAGGFAEMPSVCQGGAPVNMLIMHGTADSKVPWRGIGIEDSQGNRQLITLSIANTMKYWTIHNHCGPEVKHQSIKTSGNSPGTEIKIFVSDNCANSTSAVLYAIIGGGHNWPGVPNFIPPEVAGLVNLDIHASDVIWDYFKSRQVSN